MLIKFEKHCVIEAQIEMNYTYLRYFGRSGIIILMKVKNTGTITFAHQSGMNFQV